MYNEEANAESIISEAEGLFKQLALDCEIIIIESGSTDRTWGKINEIIRDKKNVRAFHQDKREGIGSALRLGYSKCTKDLICHLEADSPFDLINFKKAIPLLYKNDCVIGYRVGTKEQNFKWSYYNISRQGAFLRQLYHSGYNFILRLLFGLTAKDVNFSFKIFKREYIQKLHLISDGWFIDAEILLELRRNGIVPVEIPVEYKDRIAGNSTVSFFSPLHILYEMVKYLKSSKK